jgi:hypothetical protein
MAAASGPLIWCPQFFGGNDGFSVTNHTLDASTDAVEAVGQVDEAMTVTHIGIRQGIVTGDDAKVFRVSIQSVDSSVLPSGTVLGTSNLGYADYTATAAKNSTWQKLALGENVSLTCGQTIGVVIKWQSGTALSAGTQQVTFGSTVGSSFNFAAPPIKWLSISNNAGSRTRNRTGPPVALYSSTHVSGTAIHTAPSSYQYNSATAGADEYGMALTLPSGWGTSYKLAGAWVFANLVTGTTHDLTLWSNASPPVQLATCSIDGDFERANEAVWYRFMFTDTTLPTLNFGTRYNLTLFNNHASTNMALHNLSVLADEDWLSYDFREATMHEIKRLNAASSFTDTTTARPLIVPILADITPPSGGGGGGGVVIGNGGPVIRGLY